MRWTTIIYQIPRDMHKNRMAVWRKLKSMAALNVLQSIWILPESAAAEKEFLALKQQINQDGGKSVFCVTLIEDEGQNQKLIDDFNNERDLDYHELMDKCHDFELEMQHETERENFTYAELEENEHEVEKLHIWLNKIIQKDYFHCAKQSEALDYLQKCKKLLNQFSDAVYDRSAD